MLLVCVALPCVIMQRHHYRNAGVACSRLAETGLLVYALCYAFSVVFRSAALSQQVSIAAHLGTSVELLALAGDCATLVAFAVTVRGLVQVGAAYRAFVRGAGAAELMGSDVERTVAQPARAAYVP